MRISVKPKTPRSYGGWELYEYNRGKHGKMLFGHEDGYWAVLNPNSGIPMIVYSPTGLVDEEACVRLQKLARLALKGTDGVRQDIADLVVEGGAADAYDEWNGL